MIHNRGINDDAANSDDSPVAAAPAVAQNATDVAATRDEEVAHWNEQKARERASALANPELVAIMAESARRARASIETPLPRGFATLTVEAGKDATLLARMHDANRGAHALLAHSQRAAY